MNTASAVASIAPGNSGLDLLLTGCVILIAGFFLYRRLWRNQGACSGCSGQRACAANSCAPVQTIEIKKRESP
jgi:hypothetical protein